MSSERLGRPSIEILPRKPLLSAVENQPRVDIPRAVSGVEAGAQGAPLIYERKDTTLGINLLNARDAYLAELKKPVTSNRIAEINYGLEILKRLLARGKVEMNAFCDELEKRAKSEGQVFNKSVAEAAYAEVEKLMEKREVTPSSRPGRKPPQALPDNYEASKAPGWDRNRLVNKDGTGVIAGPHAPEVEVITVPPVSDRDWERSEPPGWTDPQALALGKSYKESQESPIRIVEAEEHPDTGDVRDLRNWQKRSEGVRLNDDGTREMNEQSGAEFGKPRKQQKSLWSRMTASVKRWFTYERY